MKTELTKGQLYLKRFSYAGHSFDSATQIDVLKPKEEDEE